MKTMTGRHRNQDEMASFGRLTVMISMTSLLTTYLRAKPGIRPEKGNRR